MEALAISGVGAICAVGLSTAEVAASVRAGIVRAGETSIMGQTGEPLSLAEVPDDGLPPLRRELMSGGWSTREARLLRLAGAALRECVAGMPVEAAPPALVLALPEHETMRPLDEARFLDGLVVQSRNAFDRQRSEAVFRGRAGGLRALQRATDWLRTGAAFVVAGGVDTFLDLTVLAALDAERRVKTETNPDSFVPGEGAAFLLLTREGTKGVRVLARLAGAAAGLETGHLYSEEPYRGEGLAAVVAVALGDEHRDVAEVFASMNGENYWAKEWGVATMRNHARFAADHGFHHPADCHGDVGAAAGPLMAILAALGIDGGYRGSPSLVYASSDQGERAAVVISR